jgi:integrase
MASFEQDKNNRLWSIRFRMVEFGKVKNKRLSGFKTKKDAEQGYRDYLERSLNCDKSNNHDMTFAQLFKKYQEYSNGKLKVSSIYDRDNVFNKHLLPVFQDMKVFKITKKDILLWQNNVNKQGYSYEYKSKLRRNMGTLFKFGVMYFDLPSNPVYQVEPFRRIESKKEMPIWTIDNFRDFISTFENNDTYKVFFSLLYLTGCRKGEAFALIWQDIDFTNKTISITKNLTRKIKNKAYEIVSTKTNEIRTILIPDTLVDMLQTHKKLSLHHRQKDFVFGGDYPLAEMTTTRKFKEHTELSGVPPIHIHCLRHSHASLLINNGENIVAIAKRLGHSSIEQTLNTYSHLMPNTEKDMVAKLNIKI